MDKELQKAALDWLVRGESHEAVLAELQKSTDMATAQIILTEARTEYLALKLAGQLNDYEYDLHFNPAKNRLTIMEYIGSVLILVALFGVAFAYFTSAEIEVYKFCAVIFALGFCMCVLRPIAAKVENGHLLFRLFPFWWR